jgi:hypothetical protein
MAANEELNRILQILATTAPDGNNNGTNNFYYSSAPPAPPPPPPSGTLGFEAGRALPSPPLLTSPAVVDPRTIVEWAPAVRYVTKTLSRDEAVMTAIKKVALNFFKKKLPTIRPYDI